VRSPLQWLADQLLSAIQRRCEHPDHMVASDILDGCSDDIELSYCRRCGGVRITFKPGARGEWRLPYPNLWRGK
jgi:hypothetical protein